jgi:hypothetical protein
MASRLRAAFALANAPRPWGFMAVLSFGADYPASGKTELKRFVRWARGQGWPRYQWAWAMEFQKRGAPHYHVFLEAGIIDAYGGTNAHRTERYRCRGKSRDVLRGALSDAVTGGWLSCLDAPQAEEVRFAAGGLVEPLRSTDGAARYVAKEASKRLQKTLPPGVTSAGRWWWLNPAFAPIPEGRCLVDVWPYPGPLARVWDKHAVVLDLPGAPGATAEQA